MKAEELWEKSKQFLVSEQPIELPEVIYHYCPLSSFMGIIQSGEIWLSHQASMNDLTEARWFYHNLAEEAKKRITEQNKKRIQSFLHKFEQDIKDYFIASFSKAPDVLSQWTMYADNGRGVAIGFHTHKFEMERKVPRFGTSKLGIFPITYLESTIRERAKELIELAAEGIWGDTLPSVEPLILATKHEGFENEKEVRIVEVQDMRTNYNPDITGLRKRHPGESYRYRVRGNNELIMYRSLSYRNKNNVFNLHSLWLGPQNEIDYKALDGLLNSEKIVIDNGVQRSDIPYFQL